MAAVEQMTDPVTGHGEGPMWDGREQRIRWVDLTSGEILSMSPGDSIVARRRIGEVAAVIRPRRGGGFVAGVERGFVLIEDSAEDGELHYLGDVWTDSSIRMNEGGCDPQGRFYCGSMAYDHAPGRGSLFRLDPDLSVTTVLEDVSISNGIAWSGDGAEAYYIDSARQSVDAFRFNEQLGTFHDRRVVASVSPDVGTPDGLTVDADGGIWVALYRGGSVHRYLPTGELDHVVELPVSLVTACAFGGSDLDQLYVTTSRAEVAAGEEPAAGALFRIELGVTGAPVAEFAG